MAQVMIKEKRIGSAAEVSVTVDGKNVIGIDGSVKEMVEQADLLQMLAKALGSVVKRERHTVEVIA